MIVKDIMAPFELYQPVPSLTGFYDMVAAAAKKFDGSNPVRTIKF